MRLNLKQSGILLVSVLLLFELAFVGVLATFLHSAEDEAQKEVHAKEVLARTNDLAQIAYECGQCLKRFAESNDSKDLAQFDRINASVPQLMGYLRANLEKDELPLFNRIEDDLNRGLAIMRKVRAQIVSQPLAVMIMPLARANAELDPLLKHMLPNFIELRKHQEQLQVAIPEQQRKLRHQMEQVLFGSVVTNIVFAFAAIALFMQRISSRLEVLVDNTIRLGAEKPLNEPMSGNDEIAFLDRVFHQLAGVLAETKEKELALQRMRQEFVAMVSHDLKTPLTAVQGYVQLLNMGVFGELPADARVRGHAAQLSLDRLVKLVNDLLDLEKLESGTFTIQLSPASMADILQRSVDETGAQAEQAGVEIDVPACSAALQADADRIVQVLVNLISNAIKFSPRGGTVEVAVTELPHHIEVRVKDEGRGVPDELKETIFERFRQVEAEDASEKRGTGLGLAICKTIVEQHRGEIGVQSRLGEGSQFWFRLPRDAADQVAPSSI